MHERGSAVVSWDVEPVDPDPSFASPCNVAAKDCTSSTSRQGEQVNHKGQRAEDLKNVSSRT